MAGLHVWTANRLERLAETLAGRTRVRADDPFTPEIIVVQSRGMQRWLSLEIARINGIAANLDFPFPDSFLQRMLALLIPEIPEAPTLQQDAMTFGIFARLPRLASTQPEFGPIRTYLQNDPHGVRRLQLAEQIAYLFDQYLVYRPDMIQTWDSGRIPADDSPAGWQAVLWTTLADQRAGGHRAERWQRLREKVAAGVSRPADLPRRVSVFGISYLPPFYLQALDALSRMMTIELYQLNPCREYWADIVSREEGQRLQRPLRDIPGAPAEADLHLEEGHRLLAVMGGQGRAFHRLMAQFDAEMSEDFQPVGGDSLLAALQEDILNLRHPAREAADRPDAVRDDRSVQVHACHSPMREIEILYDQLLDRLNADADLAPWDILVLTPDIDLYAPYIQAVFGAPEEDALRLPFSIADRSPLQSRPLVEAFFTLLGLKQSRFLASDLMGLLDLAAVRSAFDLAEEDGRLIGAWVAETRIRWGADAGTKAALGLPPTGENTWQAGLDRLLLGYALPAEKEMLFEGILPARGVEGTNPEVLGHLVRFVAQLKDWQSRLSRKRPPAEWTACLLQMIEAFFQPALEEEEDLQLLRRLIAGMRQHSATAGLDEAVEIEVVRAYLKRRLEKERSGSGFISGGITFGALLPMRSIPSKMICLLGMNQDIFPREDRPPGFDLMAAAPRLGDRSRRSDDQYLFLEALISARRYLYISYIGFDIQDNAVLPPSVLVSELLDYLTDSYGRSAEGLVVHHRLQPFAADYFRPEHPDLFSYSRQFRNAAASLASRRAGAAPAPFIDRTLSAWADDWETVAIDTLVRALSHPCRFLLEYRLQVQLLERETETRDRESFQLDSLEHYRLGQDLIESLLAQTPVHEALKKARAAGRLPHGMPGHMRFEEVYAEAEEIANAVRACQAGDSVGHLDINEQLPPFTITGRLTSVYPGGQVLYRYSRAGGPDLIGAWLRHLVWCRHTDHTAAGTTTLVTRDGRRLIRGVDPGAPYLKQLLDLYRRAGHEPVRLFPRSSWDYAVLRFEKGYSPAKALARIRDAWDRPFGWPGESADPYLQQCFGRIDPLDEDFAATAEAVYGPILQHLVKV